MTQNYRIHAVTTIAWKIISPLAQEGANHEESQLPRTITSEYIEVEPILCSSEESALDEEEESTANHETSPPETDATLFEVKPLLLELEEMELGRSLSQDPSDEEEFVVVDKARIFDEPQHPALSVIGPGDENTSFLVEPILMYLEEESEEAHTKSESSDHQKSSDSSGEQAPSLVQTVDSSESQGSDDVNPRQFSFLTAIDPDNLNSSLLRSSSDDPGQNDSSNAEATANNPDPEPACDRDSETAETNE